ncbi:MAG: TIGR00730 family Rossman fold protein [Spirochaetes bacterium]|nr:TIGR00730 family Rossman fold protein [Spirochaetota bacterium]
MNKICVFCGSSCGNNPVYTEAAKELGRLFAANNITLIYGGAKVGIMGVLADEILEAGGKVTGIIPKFLRDSEVAHNDLTELILVTTMHERKDLMQKEADGFIAMPGGLGTIEEIFEMITWGQLNLHKKPCAFLNINGFYDLINGFLENAVKEGFIEKEIKDIIIIESDPAAVMDRFSNYVHHNISKAEIALRKKAAKE